MYLDQIRLNARTKNLESRRTGVPPVRLGRGGTGGTPVLRKT